MAFVAVLLATLTLIGGGGEQEGTQVPSSCRGKPGAIRHRHRIGTRYRGNDHGSRVSSRDTSWLTETREIEKILIDRIAEQCTMTQIDRITINDDLGTEADGNYIALVYLTWGQKNTGKTSKKMLEMYSSDLAATLVEHNSSVNEIAFSGPYHISK